MDVVHLTLSVEESAHLKSLVIARRLELTRYYQEYLNSIAELEALEDKLSQITIAKYEQVIARAYAKAR